MSRRLDATAAGTGIAASATHARTPAGWRDLARSVRNAAMAVDWKLLPRDFGDWLW